MALVGIKNKYLRRTILILVTPPLATIGVVATGIFIGGKWMMEAWLELPGAVAEAWRGRD